MHSSFDRLLSLAQKTGDKLIIFDKHSDQHHVLLPIEEYEDLLDTGFGYPDPASAPYEPGVDFSSPDSETGGTWSTAGDVLEDLHTDFELPAAFQSDQSDELVDYFSEGDDDIFFDDSSKQAVENKKPVSPLSYEPLMQPMGPEPIVRASESVEEDMFVEEPLGDEEPIFFEEPVE